MGTLLASEGRGFILVHYLDYCIIFNIDVNYIYLKNIFISICALAVHGYVYTCNCYTYWYQM